MPAPALLIPRILFTDGRTAFPQPVQDLPGQYPGCLLGCPGKLERKQFKMHTAQYRYRAI